LKNNKYFNAKGNFFAKVNVIFNIIFNQTHKKIAPLFNNIMRQQSVTNKIKNNKIFNISDISFLEMLDNLKCDDCKIIDIENLYKKKYESLKNYYIMDPAELDDNGISEGDVIIFSKKISKISGVFFVMAINRPRNHIDFNFNFYSRFPQNVDAILTQKNYDPVVSISLISFNKKKIIEIYPENFYIFIRDRSTWNYPKDSIFMDMISEYTKKIDPEKLQNYKEIKIQ
jgi:hypothetical protein